MLKKFTRTKVADLTVGKSLAYNFVVPIVQVAGYALSLGIAADLWRRSTTKTDEASATPDPSED